MQFSISIFVEVTNYIIIFYSSTSVIDVVADFLVVLVISEFDDYLYSVSGSKVFKKLITEEKYKDLFRIETTTSPSASLKMEEHRIMNWKYVKDEIYSC